MTNLEFFAQVVLGGLSRGAVIGLVAVGIVVVYSCSRLLNFAAGEFVMIGGLVAWVGMELLGLPYPVVFVLVVLAGAVAGAGVEMAVVAPLRRRGIEPISIIIALLGVSIVVSQGMQYLIGPATRTVRTPVPGPPIDLGGVVLGRHAALTMVAAVVAGAVFWAIRKYTRLGLELRAVGANRQGALVTGMNVVRLERYGFALAGSVAAFAGLFIAPGSGWRPTMGLSIALLAFIAAIVGGISNPLSAYVGALFVGVASSMIEAYISPLYSTVLMFGVLMIVVLVRPSGLVPSRETQVGPLRA